MNTSRVRASVAYAVWLEAETDALFSEWLAAQWGLTHPEDIAYKAYLCLAFYLKTR